MRFVVTGVIELERVAARGWQGTSTLAVGDWLLRAGAGFTGRANSVLPLGSPGLALDRALSAVDEFYREHELTPLFQIPADERTAGLDAELGRRGWRAFHPTGMLVAGIDPVIAACPPRAGLPPARFEARPSPAWLSGYEYRGTPLPATAVQVLVNAENVVFGSVSDERGQAAVVRGVVTDGWLGVTALTVAAARRRGGFGRHLMGELARWARSRGARRVYLQVADENTAALGLYDALGFARHHGYHYRRPPTGSG